MNRAHLQTYPHQWVILCHKVLQPPSSVSPYSLWLPFVHTSTTAFLIKSSSYVLVPLLVCMSLKSKYMFSHSVVSNFCNSMDCTLPGSSVHVISQARILEWIVISSFWGYIFSTQGLNPSLLHWQMDSLPLNHQGSPQGQGQCLNLSSIPTPDPVHASDIVLVYSWWMNEIINKMNEWLGE